MSNNYSNVEMLIDIKMKLQDLRRDAESYERCLIADVWQISSFIEQELDIGLGVTEEFDENTYKRLKEEVESEIFYTEKYFSKYGNYLEESIHKLIALFREQCSRVNKIMYSTKTFNGNVVIENKMKEVKSELENLENECGEDNEKS